LEVYAESQSKQQCSCFQNSGRPPAAAVVAAPPIFLRKMIPIVQVMTTQHFLNLPKPILILFPQQKRQNYFQ